MTNGREALEQLRQNEHRYRSLFEVSPVPMWEGDWSAVKSYLGGMGKTGVQDLAAYFAAKPEAVRQCATRVRVLAVNQAGMRFLGASCRDEIPTCMSAWLAEGSWDVFRDQLVALAAGGMRFEGEGPILSPSGSVRHVMWQISLVSGRLQDWSRVAVSLVDITARRQAEDELRRHEEQFRTSAESMLDGFAILTAVRDVHNTIVDLRYEYVNQVGCRSMQRTRSEVIGNSFLELLPEHMETGLFLDYVLVIETGRPLVKEVLEKGRAGSGQLIRAFDIQAVRSGDGCAVTWREVTERKHAEQLMRQAKEAAEEAKREQQARRRLAERRRQSAESLGRILAALNSGQPFDEILQFTASQARQLLESQATAIYRWKDRQEGLVMSAADGLPDDLMFAQGVSVDRAVLEQAVSARQPIAFPFMAPKQEGVAAVGPEIQPQADWTSQASPYRALLAAPILAEGDTYGAILFYYSEPRTFTGDEAELAVVFGSQIALAIENARLRDELERAAITAERSRLARDLHDAVTQTLFSASIIAEALPRVWERHPQEGRDALQQLCRLTRGALAEMRTLLFELRPAGLEEKSMGELLRHLTTAMSGPMREPIQLTVTGGDDLLPNVKIALYRIAEEALNNVVKHANARHVEVELACRSGKVVFRISDDGAGFDPRGVGQGHLGLNIMRERAESIGATLQIENRSGNGTEVVIEFGDRNGVAKQ